MPSSSVSKDHKPFSDTGAPSFMLRAVVLRSERRDVTSCKSFCGDDDLISSFNCDTWLSNIFLSVSARCHSPESCCFRWASLLSASDRWLFNARRSTSTWKLSPDSSAGLSESVRARSSAALSLSSMQRGLPADHSPQPLCTQLLFVVHTGYMGNAIRSSCSEHSCPGPSPCGAQPACASL